MDYTQLAKSTQIEKTVNALKANGISAVVVANAAAALEEVIKIIPAGAEVLTMTSVTLDTIGVTKEINESKKYNSVKNQLNTLDRTTQSDQMQKMGAAPDWVIGSVHAITEGGQVLVASNTGSQLPAYSYAANHVIWVVGTQKIVPTMEAALDRINTYVLDKESARVKIAYGMDRSNVSKLLIFNKEINPSRITVIFVSEQLGY